MRPIGPRTQLCGVLLHPAGHTRSPAMHNAAFAALDIDAVYVAFDVPPRALPAAVAGARALGVRQLAVSIPHKEAMLALCTPHNSHIIGPAKITPPDNAEQPAGIRRIDHW